PSRGERRAAVDVPAALVPPVAHVRVVGPAAGVHAPQLVDRPHLLLPLSGWGGALGARGVTANALHRRCRVQRVYVDRYRDPLPAGRRGGLLLAMHAARAVASLPLALAAGLRGRGCTVFQRHVIPLSRALRSHFRLHSSLPRSSPRVYFLQ